MISRAMPNSLPGDRAVASFMLIPPDARVEPAQFPEQEYPVTCPHCGYLLTALPEPRCPECGEPFDRGRLLVVQYVVEPIPSQWRSRSKMVDRCAQAALIVWALWLLVTGTTSKASVDYGWWGYFGLLVLSLLMLGLARWSAFRNLPERLKRYRVKRALEAQQEERWRP